MGWHIADGQFYDDVGCVLARYVLAQVRPKLLRMHIPLSLAQESGPTMSRLASRSVATAMYPARGYVAKTDMDSFSRSMCSDSIGSAMYTARGPVLAKGRRFSKASSSDLLRHADGRQLCGLIMVARHADRMPKQKAKCKTKNPLVLELMAPGQRTQLRLKTTSELEGFAKVLRQIVEAPAK